MKAPTRYDKSEPESQGKKLDNKALRKMQDAARENLVEFLANDGKTVSVRPMSDERKTEILIGSVQTLIYLLAEVARRMPPPLDD